jgi:hypothetical protein
MGRTGQIVGQGSKPLRTVIGVGGYPRRAQRAA